MFSNFSCLKITDHSACEFEVLATDACGDEYKLVGEFDVKSVAGEKHVFLKRVENLNLLSFNTQQIETMLEYKLQIR